MSHLLRRPAAVPAMFARGVENDRAPRRAGAQARSARGGSAMLVVPALLLAVEVPFMRGAAELLRLALPH